MKERQHFIDWMKSLGMFAIVVGHIIGSPFHIFNLASQPIYTKQLGVCFFIFIMGWGLANEKRRSFQVVFNRIFPIYFYGIFFAVLLSSIYIFTINDINESNYLPFFLGINVLFNYFPANPTTWYIGTYLHVLLFWFIFLRGRQITLPLVAIACVSEIAIRTILLYQDIEFVAYMALPNWITVFFLGAYLCQRKDASWNLSTTVLILVWLVFVVIWASSYNSLISPKSFPFREISGVDNLYAFTPSFQRSLLISFIYIFNTYVFFEVLRRLPGSKIVGFFARHSLVTFIVHMPLIYAFNKPFYALFENKALAQWIFIILIFVACALLSEMLNRVIKVSYLQQKAWLILERFLPEKLKKQS